MPNGSSSTKKSRANRKSKASGEPGRKAGNQGNFHGPRKEFLEDLIPAYLVAVKSHQTPTFWGPTYASFHKKFDWRIPLKQPYPENHTFCAEEEQDVILDEGEVALKRETTLDINKVRDHHILGTCS